MTDNEIIKTMKGCACTPDCNWCAYFDPKQEYSEKCYKRRNRDFDNLINRQKAEIERLNKRIKEQKHALFEQQSYTADLQKQILTAKFEAVKEFVNRLKEKKLQSTMDKRIISMETIDNLVKEMVGEDNA